MSCGTTRSALLVGAMLAVTAGCAAVPRPPGSPSLLVVNKSQFLLQQLMVHERVDRYAGAPNLLAAAPLDPERQLTLRQPTIEPGTWFVTVVREKVRHGPLVAITTAEGLELLDGLYTLWVFDESFRFWKPALSDGAPPDSGPDRPRLDGRAGEGLALDRRADAGAADRATGDSLTNQ